MDFTLWYMIQITTNWKILKDMGIPDHLTCLLRNLCMQIKKQHLEPGMEQWTDSKLGKETIKAVLSPHLFNSYAAKLCSIIIFNVPIKLPTSVGSLKKQESSRKTSISALLTMPNPLCGLK